MIIVIARFTLTTGKKQEFLQRISEAQVIEKSRADQGNISYEFLNSNENPDEIVVLERWESAEALKIHSQAPHFMEMVKIQNEIGSSPSEILTYKTTD